MGNRLIRIEQASRMDRPAVVIKVVAVGDHLHLRCEPGHDTGGHGVASISR